LVVMMLVVHSLLQLQFHLGVDLHLPSQLYRYPEYHINIITNVYVRCN
jgi:hypothetical protein